MTKLISLFILSSTFALSKPIFFNNLQANFPTHILINRCNTCHAHNAAPKLNSFGLAYDSVFIRSTLPVQGMDPKQKFDYLMGLDSNKNGKTNLEDILADIIPGV